ncbi:head maturation protease, ClpP-related [Phenylobacterium sp.]|uniref:head maturation protease, ClpP-related n=1 Tax=Phenylobacterium sp. TaxID=1871053 RepID=UPI003919F480
MSKRALPAAAIAARPGFRTVPAVSALDRYEPGVRAATGTDEPASISVFGVIGEDFWTGEGVTAKRISAALRSVGAKTDVAVNVNSPGGDYFEGLAIYNLLREHQGKVTVNILGMAASAASVIAMAGDETRIARAGFLMIHNVWVVAAGDRHQLRDAADWLEPFDQVAREIYAARTGLSDKDLGAMLDRETWIGGAEAVAKGFADDLLASDQVTVDPEGDGVGQAKALHKLDAVLARAGMTRTERRKLFADLKAGMPSAAQDDTPSAGVRQELEALRTALAAI